MDYNIKSINNFYELLNHEKETEIRVLDPKFKLPPRSPFVHSKEEFLKECIKYNGKYNVYAAINERKAKGTKATDVKSVKTIVLDIDAIREKGFEKDSATEKELKKSDYITNKILKFYKEKGFETPIIVHSGNGKQLFSRIPKIVITDKNRNEIQSKIQRFHKLIKKECDLWDCVDNIGDLPRIIKVTGTLNIKGNNTKERPFRIAKFENNPEEIKEDSALKDFILSLEVEEEEINNEYGEYDLPEQIEVLEDSRLPDCMNYLLNRYVHNQPHGWMRIIEVLASFFKGVGLKKHVAIQKIVFWNKKQPYHEPGELKDICFITNKIYSKNIMCPNFNKLVRGEGGFPHMTLEFIFRNVKLRELNSIYKNPVSYYLNKNKDLKPQGWANSIKISRLAKRYNLETCPTCKKKFKFTDKLGWWECSCGKGGIKKFATLILKSKLIEVEQ